MADNGSLFFNTKRRLWGLTGLRRAVVLLRVGGDVDEAPVVLLAPGGDDGAQRRSAERMELTARSSSSRSRGGARTERERRRRDVAFFVPSFRAETKPRKIRGGAQEHKEERGRNGRSWGRRGSPDHEGHGGGNCKLRRGISTAWGHDWRGSLRGKEEGVVGAL